MERTSHTNASFVDLARWVISVTIFLLLIAPCIYKGQRQPPRFVEKAFVSEHWMTPENALNTEIAWLIDSFLSEQTNLQDEIIAEFERANMPGIDFSGSTGQRQPHPLIDQGISLERADLLRADPASLSAPAHSYPEPEPASLPEGGTKIKPSQPLQEKDSGATNEKTPSLPQKEKAERRFDPIIQRAAKNYGVDPALVRAIIMAESSYNPRAVSKRGARGLMQLMPRTAEYLGVKDSFNPEHNIDAGVRYFKKLLGQFNGDVKLALAAYNAGSRKVREYKGIPPFKATQHCVKKVFKYHQHYKK
jgi:hypothetical protein